MTDDTSGPGAPDGSAGEAASLPHGGVERSDLPAGASDDAPTRARWTPPEDDETAPAPRDLPRAVTVLLAVVAAGCLVAACFSHDWLTNRHVGDFGYSPLSYRDCRLTCTTISNFQLAENVDLFSFEVHRIPRVFPITGLATFVALLVAAAGLLLAAGLALANKRPDLPVSPTTFTLLGLLIGLVTGCVFVATKPGAVGAVGVDWSFWAFGIGSVAGIAAAQMLARQIRPVDPDLLHDAMNADRF